MWIGTPHVEVTSQKWSFVIFSILLETRFMKKANLRMALSVHTLEHRQHASTRTNNNNTQVMQKIFLQES